MNFCEICGQIKPWNRKESGSSATQWGKILDTFDNIHHAVLVVMVSVASWQEVRGSYPLNPLNFRLSWKKHQH